MFLYIIFIVVGFLLGSVMFCDIIPARMAGVKVSEKGEDRNPGSYNVFKICGPKLGFLCLSLDILKGFLPVCLATFLLSARNVLYAFVMAAPVLGHAVGLFNHFHGGKCIATIFGVTLGAAFTTILPFVLLALLFVVFSTLIKFKSSRVRGIVVFALFGVASFVVLSVFNQLPLAIGCLLIATIAVAKHCFQNQSVVVAEEEEEKHA